MLSRHHLLDHFQEMLAFRCISVAAPAGYGKTTLLIDAAHHLNLPVCWFSIDPLDNEPSRFFSHFLAAITQTFPQFGTVLAEINPSQADSLSSVVTSVVNAIYDHIQEYFVFVLDDFHLITNREIISFIDQFLMFVDENCHLVIASRELVELPNLLLLAGRAELGGIGAGKLAFRPEEIQALIRQNYNTTLSDKAAAELVEATGGWITGLLLSTQSVWKNTINRLQLARLSGINVYDYLASQVFNQQPASVQDFLLRTSLLDEFNSKLCQDVFGPSHYPDGHTWHTLIQLVLQNNLFAVQLDDQGMWLRYHHLFQEFLQNRIRTEYPAEATKIIRQLAVVFTDQSEWEKAYDLYQRLGDASATAALIERAGNALVIGGRFNLLGRWIDALAPGVIENHPQLKAHRGYVAAMTGDVQHGKLLLDQAIVMLQDTNDIPMLAKTFVWRAGVNRLLGHPQAAIDDVEESLRLIKGNDAQLALSAMALRAKGQFLCADRHVEESIIAFEQSLELYKSLSSNEEVARLYLETGIAYMLAGRYERARRYFGVAEKYFQVSRNRVRLADLYNNWGVLYHLTGHYLQAIATLEKALTLARQSEYARIEAYTLAGIGDIYIDLEALDAANTAYGEAHQQAIQADDKFLLLYLEVVKARWARLNGDFPQAQTLLSYARHSIDKSGGNYEVGLLKLEAGQLALAQHQFEKAITCLQQAIDLFYGDGLQVERANAYLHLAGAFYAEKKQSEVNNCITAALANAQPLEVKHPLIAAGRRVKPALKQAKKAGLDAEVDSLLEKIRKFETDLPNLRKNIRRQSLAVQFAAPPLVIRTLGIIEVLQNNAPVTSADWQNQRRAREVFFYLLGHPDGYTREVIGLDLWPESSQSELKIQFKNTMYRLRRALGKEVILYDSDLDRYYFNRELDYEYDVEQFMQYLTQTKATDIAEEKIELLTGAVNLYNGPYLPDMEQTWVLPKRQRFSHLYIQANLQLATLYLQTAQQFDAALTPCWNILREDPCHEATHRLIMTIHAQAGNRAGIVRQFEQCRKALLDEVNAPVSSQTLHHYQHLLHQ